MRAMFGLIGLVVALAVVGVLVKKQLSASRAPLVLPAPAGAVPAGEVGAGAPALPPASTVRAQSQQMQEQIKQQMEGLMQQARPMPEDPK